MTFADIINQWPSLSEFADDLGVAYGTAKAMRRRSALPSMYWCRTVEKAAERGLANITLDMLAQIDAERLDLAEGNERRDEHARQPEIEPTSAPAHGNSPEKQFHEGDR